MPADLVIRGARIVDGTGLPAYGGDLAVTDGRISAIGRGLAGRRHLDADGLFVTPGFIDLHTHYDAQLMFEPTASPSSWHGVTTVVTGNCGFTFAPAKREDIPFLLGMLSRVEGMVPEALAAGVTFEGGEFGEYLSQLDGRLGVNTAALVGHCAVRRWVMGEDASTRAATDDEIADMQVLVRAALAQGAIGFSTSQLEIHADHNGMPVPSNLADPEEIVALASVLAEVPNGIIQIFPRSMRSGYSPEDQQLMTEISEASGNKVMSLNNLSYVAATPDAWKRSAAYIERGWNEGRRMYPFFVANPLRSYFTLGSTGLFDEFPTFRTVLPLPAQERAQRLHDPAVRDAIKAEVVAAHGKGVIAWEWDIVILTETASPDRAKLLGRSIASIAAERHTDPIDTLIDLSLADDLGTLFCRANEVGAVERSVTEDLMRRPYTLVGSSDGGAHVLTFCGADYTTRFLDWAVPDVMTFERAISRLSMVPATLLGLGDRGVIREGAAADLLVLDRAALSAGGARFVHDFPADSERLVVDAGGYRHVVVNGEVTIRDNVPTGARSGAVIRRPGSASRLERG